MSLTAQFRFAETRLRTGVQVHYAERGDPDGPAIVCLHGYTDSWFSFSRLLPSFSDEYRVLRDVEAFLRDVWPQSAAVHP